MKRLPVTSSGIRSVGYDDDAGHMEVEFHNGRLYRYHQFPKRLHSKFLNARSIGDFFHVEIRPFYKGIEVKPLKESQAKDEEQGT